MTDEQEEEMLLTLKEINAELEQIRSILLGWEGRQLETDSEAKSSPKRKRQSPSKQFRP
jgi:hypothetical protein